MPRAKKTGAKKANTWRRAGPMGGARLKLYRERRAAAKKRAAQSLCKKLGVKYPPDVGKLAAGYDRVVGRKRLGLSGSEFREHRLIRRIRRARLKLTGREREILAADRRGRKNLKEMGIKTGKLRKKR